MARPIEVFLITPATPEVISFPPEGIVGLADELDHFGSPDIIKVSDQLIPTDHLTKPLGEGVYSLQEPQAESGILGLALEVYPDTVEKTPEIIIFEAGQTAVSSQERVSLDTSRAVGERRGPDFIATTFVYRREKPQE